MLSWDVPAAELDDLIQYVKAFAPRWRNEQPGEAIVAPPDPWADREADGIERGRRVYHGLAQCATACHPAYATKQEIYDFTKELTKMELREMRGDLYFAVAKDSDYGVKILPPDFTFNEMRGGEALDDIYRADRRPASAAPRCPPGRTSCPIPICGRWLTTFVRWSRSAARPKPPRFSAACSTSRPGRRRRCPTPVPTAATAVADAGGQRRKSRPSRPSSQTRPSAPPIAVIPPRPGSGSTVQVAPLPCTTACVAALPRSRPTG